MIKTLFTLAIMTVCLSSLPLTSQTLTPNQNKWNLCQRKTGLMTQISNSFAKAGANPTQTKTAQKVACFESNMDCKITSKRNRNGSFDTGLFQINSVHRQQNMNDCQANIDYAIKLSKSGKNFKPWYALRKALTVK